MAKESWSTDSENYGYMQCRWMEKTTARKVGIHALALEGGRILYIDFIKHIPSNQYHVYMSCQKTLFTVTQYLFPNLQIQAL